MADGDDGDLCIHEMLKGTCSLCKPKVRKTTPTFRRPGEEFHALFRSTCAECSNTIYPGDEMRPSIEGWVHASCDT